MKTLKYKSPPHKLITFFEDSRDKWEKKAKDRVTEIRDLKAKIRHLEESRSHWKEVAADRDSKTEQAKEACHLAQQELQDMQNSYRELYQEHEELKKKARNY